MRIYESFYEWYIKLYDQLNGCIMKLKTNNKLIIT